MLSPRVNLPFFALGSEATSPSTCRTRRELEPADDDVLSLNPVVVVEGTFQMARNFFVEVGSLFWFIVHTFGETIERIRNGRVPFRATSFFRHTERAGVDSVPLVALVSFFLGLTMALLTGYQLQRFGTERLVPGLVAIGFTRELGPLITGIMLAARIGAAFTAELGTMQVSEEVEAIEAMGIGPLRFLVAPRMLALVLLMPCLSTVSNLAAIAATSFVCWSLFQHRVRLLCRSGPRCLAHSRYYHRRAQEFHIRLPDRRDRLLPRAHSQRRRGRRRNCHHFERGHRHHLRDRFRYALQHRLHRFFSNVSASDSHVVELRDVHLQFEEKKVLDGVSLQVEPCERLVVMGQSGSGKSTILRLILGILQPEAGSIFFKQFEITRLRRRKLQQVRRHIGMVYQYSALLSSRTVRDNVALPLEELTDKSREEIDEIVDEKLELVGMREAKDRLPSEISGGMRKRVSLARALVMEPELILFDEPSAGLDPVISSVIDELIINLTKKSNVTSIIVTHDMGSAFRIGTRMAMLYQGKIIEEATPEEFRRSQNPVVAQFLSGSTEGPILEESEDAIKTK